MKKRELKQMPVNELKEKLEELQKELLKENAQVAAGTVPKNPGGLKSIKKNIARIKGLIKSKEVKKNK